MFQWPLLHIALVHFPIGLLLAIVVVHSVNQQDRFRAAIARLWLVLVPVALVVAVLGHFLAYDMGHQGSDMSVHRWAGWALVLLLAATAAAWWQRWPGYGVLLTGCAVLTVVVGHWGGRLSRGPDVWWSQPTLAVAPPAEADPAQAPDADSPDTLARTGNEHQVLPEIQNFRDHPGWQVASEYCINCHRSGNASGGLRMDELSWWRRGGMGDGTGVVWGDPDASPIYLRTLLPTSDRGHMPRKDGPLSPEQQAALAAFIQAGPWQDSDA